MPRKMSFANHEFKVIKISLEEIKFGIKYLIPKNKVSIAGLSSIIFKFYG